MMKDSDIVNPTQDGLATILVSDIQFNQPKTIPCAIACRISNDYWTNPLSEDSKNPAPTAPELDDLPPSYTTCTDSKAGESRPSTPCRVIAPTTMTSPQARQYLSYYVGTSYTMSKRVPKRMNIADISPSIVYLYEFETFIESRSKNWTYTPGPSSPQSSVLAVNNPIDPHKTISQLSNQQLWAYPVDRPTDFVKESKKTLKVDNTSFYKMCHHCEGVGSRACTSCHGAGYRNSYGSSGDENRPSSDDRESCPFCSGGGSEDCMSCIGHGTLECYLELIINWKTQCDQELFNGKFLDIDMIKENDCLGEIIYEKEAQNVDPIRNFPLNSSIIDKSKYFVERSLSARHPDNLVLLQRHRITAFEALFVRYDYKDKKDYMFAILGTNRKVLLGEYPERQYCCCCYC